MISMPQRYFVDLWRAAHRPMSAERRTHGRLRQVRQREDRGGSREAASSSSYCCIRPHSLNWSPVPVSEKPYINHKLDERYHRQRGEPCPLKLIC